MFDMMKIQHYLKINITHVGTQKKNVLSKHTLA